MLLWWGSNNYNCQYSQSNTYIWKETKNFTYFIYHVYHDMQQWGCIYKMIITEYKNILISSYTVNIYYDFYHLLKEYLYTYSIYSVIFKYFSMLKYSLENQNSSILLHWCKFLFKRRLLLDLI